MRLRACQRRHGACGEEGGAMNEPQISLWESVQHPELQRVSGRIAQSVIAFCRLHAGETFHGSELSAYVTARCGGSPSSADRILRMLRASGQVDVTLEDRSRSLYRVKGVRP